MPEVDETNSDRAAALIELPREFRESRSVGRGRAYAYRRSRARRRATAHRARTLSIFWICPILNSARAIHGVQFVERYCHSQPKEQTIAPAAPGSRGRTDTQHHG